MATRRSTYTDQPVSYAAVGATQSADLMTYPPEGYRPMEASVKLGSGVERFAVAQSAILTWSVQANSGIRVEDKQQGSGPQYQGVIFGPDGTPAADQNHRPAEQLFGPDGTPYITSGMTAVLTSKAGFFRFSDQVRVVYVIDEPRRVGFGYGTIDPRFVSSEEGFILEHRDDDSVWFTVRALTRPTTWYMRMLAPYFRYHRGVLMRRYLRALHPVNTAS